MFGRTRGIIVSFLFSIFATLFVSNFSASALQLTALEPISDPNPSIEINTPEAGYSFDATFLDKNLELKYRATVTNDESEPIEITAIDVTASSYTFLNYSYANLTVGDTLAPNETRDIEIIIKTNDQPTQTVDENLNLAIHFRIIDAPNPPPDDGPSDTPDDTSLPDTPATYDSAIVVGGILLFVGLTLAFILRKNAKLRTGILAFTLGLSGLLFSNGLASASGDYTLTIVGKIHFVNTYSVTINPNGGSYNNSTASSTESYRDGTVIHIQDATRDHYNFDGWTIEPGSLNNDGSLTVTTDTTLTAKWSPIYHTVTVDPDGGRYNNSTAPTTTEVLDGDTFTIGADATRPTYSFEGWHVENGALENGRITVNSDIYIKALWNEQYFDITIDPNGGRYHNDIATVTFPERAGKTVTVDTPERDNYNFTGWTISAGELTNNSFIVTQNVTLTANWDGPYYNITVDPNGGTYEGHTSSYTTTYPGNTELTFSRPSRDGYDFNGWTVWPGTMTNNKLIVNGNATVTAQWEPTQRNLTVDPNGGLYEGSDRPSLFLLHEGDPYTLSTPTRAHYTFAGWELTAGSIDANNTIVMHSDVTATAQWNSIDHTVTINPNGGTYADSLENAVHEGDIFTIPSTPTREHYRFIGWTASTGVLQGNKIIVNEDLTLTANWEAISFSVTINPNGGDYAGHTTSFTDEFQEGDVVNITTPTRAHYTFDGWTVTGDQIDNNKITVTQNTTIVANWKPILFTVTVDPNGGNYVGDLETQVLEGDDFTVGADPTRDTYTFTGWTASAGTLQNGKITVTQNLTITAQWQENYFNLTINPNGGSYNNSTSVQTDSVREGRTVDLTEPTREHYTFDGWTTTGNQPTNNQVTITQNTTLVANWHEITFDVTIDPNGGKYNNIPDVTTTSYQEGYVLTMGTPARSHYTFDGWQMSAGSLDTNNSFAVTQNVTLIAQWTPILFTVTVDPNGGSYAGDLETQVLEGDGFTVGADPTREHYIFDGWTVTGDSIVNGKITVTQNTALVANWQPATYDVTIDPNGGTFNGSAEIYHTTATYGETINLTNASYTNHDIRDWTKNNTETLAADITEITITEDTDLRINWWSSIKYTVTVVPNLGSYNGSTETQQFQIRKDQDFTFENVERDGYVLTFWQLDDADETRLGENASFTVTHDVTATANWALAVARIERTQKVYPSIMAAEADAQANDTITLLVDTAEIVTNEKKIILDLNNHTVTGYILNTADGDLTLINGEINNYSSPVINAANPNGAAVINNGILTMGINDYTSDGTVNIENNSIRIIGTDTGIDQNGQFYFYDGFIEGIIGLNGGYDGSPFYRNTADDRTIYYFPFVTHNEQKDCQHVELAGADRAVTKTTVHGDIYYYNLQDNINTSLLTGYPIYAVRNFDASYPIYVPADNTIDFDIEGYVVKAGDDWNIRGTMNVVDSKHDEGTGALNTARVITNEGDLNFRNIKVSALSANPVIENRSKLSLQNATISSEFGYALEVKTANTTLDMDENSYIQTSTQSVTPIHNTSTDFTIDGGHVYAPRIAVFNDGRDAKLTINGGEIKVEAPANDTSTYDQNAIRNNQGTVIVNGGTIACVAINMSNSAIGNSGSGGNITINGGEIKIYPDSRHPNISALRSINGGSAHVTINGGTISATGYTNVIGVYSSYLLDIYDGEITATTTSNTNNYETSAVYGTSGNTINVYGGTIKAITQRDNAIGIRGNNGSSPTTLNFYGGTVIAAAENPNATSTGIRLGLGKITGGSISGKTYGLNVIGETESVTIGTNDLDENGVSILNTTSPVISGGNYGVYGGHIHFFDGILESTNNPYYSYSIREIPNDAEIACSDDGQQCWLKHTANYLSVDGVAYNSLALAYNAAKNSPNEPKTIIVTDDFSTAAANPTIEKDQDITIDLNGHTIEYYTPIINNGTLTITDNSPSQNGVLHNLNRLDTSIIRNYNVLNLEAGTISGRRVAIQSQVSSSINNNPSINLNGGLVKVIGDADSATTGSINAINCNYGTSNHLYINAGASIIAQAAESATGQSVNAVSGCYTTVNGGSINASANSTVAGIYGGSKVIMNSGTITVDGKTSNVAGIYYSSNTEVNGGTITVNATTGVAAGIFVSNSTVVFNGGTIDARSINNTTYGIKTSSGTSSRGNLTVTGGNISAISTSGTGAGLESGITKITGGTVYGSTYGIKHDNDSNPTTIGVDDGTISNGPNASPMITGGTYGIYRGYVSFYDGVIRGPEPSNPDTITAYTNDSIKAIPEAALFHYENLDNRQNCWLENSEEYLLLNGVRYNSLSKAYENANDGDTIYVIADYVTQSNLPENPSNKSITLDLNDHSLSYYQSLVNRGHLTIVDNGEHHTGRLANVNPSATPTIVNYGTLDIKSGVITSDFTTIENRGATTISGGLVSTESSISSGSHIAVYNYGTLNVVADTTASTHGVVSASNDSADNFNISAINGGSSGSVININGGEVLVNRTNASWAAAYGINSAYAVNLNNAIFNIQSDGSATAVVSASGEVVVTDSTIEVNSYRNAKGITSNNGHITVNGNTYVHAVAETEQAVALYARSSSSNYPAYATINNGTFIGESTEGVGIGAELGSKGANHSLVLAGTITGSTYGVYSESDTMIIEIGENDGTITSGPTQEPIITGGTYGAYRGNIYFYDGVLKGKIDANFDRNIRNIADHAYIHTDTTADQVVRYLEPEHSVAEIDADHQFGSLKQAIDAAQTGDTITLLEDNYIYDAITIERTQDITVETNGFDIISGNRFLINGHFKLQNSNSQEETLIDYHEQNAAFTVNTIANNADQINANLELDNISLKIAYKGIEANANSTVTVSNSQITNTSGDNEITDAINSTGATVNIDNTTISVPRGTAINTSGKSTANITDSVVYSSQIGIQSVSGQATINISNSTIEGDRLHSSSANITLYVSGSAAYPANLFVDNNSNLNGRIYLNNTTGTIQNSTLASNFYNATTQLYLYGASSDLTISNADFIYNTTRNHSVSSNDFCALLYSNDGKITVTDTTFTGDWTDYYVNGAIDAILNDTASQLTANNITITLRNNVPSSSTRAFTSGIHNRGTASIDGTNINIEVNGNGTARGIYNQSGTVTLTTSTIRTTSAHDAYGIYIQEGEVTLGTAEPTTSPNYGGEHADVSTTNPDITAIGTNQGIGVYKATGRFVYYDGRILGSTFAIPRNDITTLVEKNYEPTFHTDADGYDVCILTWMLQQPTQP